MSNIKEKFESVIIFGYNDYTHQIAKEIEEDYEYLHIFTLEQESMELALHDGYNASLFDLSDEWVEIQRIENIKRVIAYCALENDEKNTFLTISLHAAFPDLFIVALATDMESANKLKIAGASKTISITQTTSGTIVDYLEKPVLTKVLHEILYKNSDLKLAQVTVHSGASLIGHELKKIAWEKHYGVIILSVSNDGLSFEYIFTAKGHKHQIQEGDVLVVIGYTKDIKKFEAEVNHETIDWSDRRW